MMRRRQFMAATMAAGAAALAGCSKSSSGGAGNGPSLRSDGNPDLTWKGTITMGAQAYTPALPGVKLAPGTAKLQEFGKVADAFTALYPDIKIKFLGSDYTYETTTMKTQATGGQLPDVWWQQHSEVNTSFPAGVCTNLAPYMEKPNPFIKGNTRWRDVLNAQSYTQSYADADTQYCNNGDFVGTAFFYNKKIFASAGISDVPKTWDELIAVCQKLKAAGTTPCAIPAYTYGFGWLARIFLANFLGEDTCKKIDAYSKDPGISTTDVAVAYKKGLLDPRQNPAVLAWWPMAKELFSYCDPQINQLPANPPVGSPNPEAMMAAGKVGMIYDGTWAPTAVAANGGGIEIGSFPWPSLAGSNQYATSFDTANAVSGPNAAWQYFISSPRSDTSLRENGKLDAVVAWMQFFSTPERNTAICNEYGSFLPTYSGAEPTKDLKELASLAAEPIYAMNGGAEFTTEANDQISKLFQAYVLGQVSMDDVTTKYPQIMDKGLQDYLQVHPIDFSKYS
ncbi:ABC-type glycerol-3-phosphate transport system substrate-binding protein [Friedmanniella endophytica]|uniref:ABC-type glycerol-3-phosphate transport system substrate-binding protein n=1 Tax=Microlunatus kandeliicorticis TaxID=1759536 RepID=A0A7W3P722_9ACTN|nr:extracellular solute-binding protein [Microlunatus kandeliicorticis]MBA8795537.1 ABC-type glycerol-3-phosphate transport system substrate-binding protein [Microlunatus kandeliicorticis]